MIIYCLLYGPLVVLCLFTEARRTAVRSSLTLSLEIVIMENKVVFVSNLFVNYC